MIRFVTLKTVISCAEDQLKFVKAEEKTKTNLWKKTEIFMDSNGKLATVAVEDRKNAIYLFLKGDSAGGSAKTARDRRIQADSAIRGKLLMKKGYDR